MSSKLRKHANLLRAFHKAKPHIRRRLLHDYCNGDFVCCIVECVKNVLKGNVKLSSAQKKKLKAKRKDLRLMTLKKTSLSKKRKIIQSGGFLGALLGPIVSVLGNLFGNGAR